MHSIPIIRLLVMSAALALAAIGVWNVTHPEAVAASESVAPTVAAETVPRSVEVELTLSPAAAVYEIETGTSVSVKGTTTGNDTKFKVDVKLPKSGADWIVRVHWKNKNVPTAVRVVCRDAASGQKMADTTLWGQGDVEDTVGVQ